MRSRPPRTRGNDLIQELEIVLRWLTVFTTCLVPLACVHQSWLVWSGTVDTSCLTWVVLTLNSLFVVLHSLVTRHKQILLVSLVAAMTQLSILVGLQRM